MCWLHTLLTHNDTDSCEGKGGGVGGHPLAAFLYSVTKPWKVIEFHFQIPVGTLLSFHWMTLPWYISFMGINVERCQPITTITFANTISGNYRSNYFWAYLETRNSLIKINDYLKHNNKTKFKVLLSGIVWTNHNNNNISLKWLIILFGKFAFEKYPANIWELIYLDIWIWGNKHNMYSRSLSSPLTPLDIVSYHL